MLQSGCHASSENRKQCSSDSMPSCSCCINKPLLLPCLTLKQISLAGTFHQMKTEVKSQNRCVGPHEINSDPSQSELCPWGLGEGNSSFVPLFPRTRSELWVLIQQSLLVRLAWWQSFIINSDCMLSLSLGALLIFLMISSCL